MKIFFKLSWLIISFFETVFWFFKRKNQLYNLCTFGKNVFISRGCNFYGNIYMGDDIYIGQCCRFQSTKATIKIGNHVMFGPDVSIHSGNHRIDVIGRYMKDIKLNEKSPENDKDIIIEDDVWIGAAAVILQGVTIGRGSVIGAGSVVTKSIPPYTIFVGSPLQKSWPRFTNKEIIQHELLLFNRN